MFEKRIKNTHYKTVDKKSPKKLLHSEQNKNIRI